MIETIGTTQKQILYASDDRAYYLIQASYSNTGIIRLGEFPDVGANNCIIELGAGDVLGGFFKDNIYALATAAGQILNVTRRNNDFPYGSKALI